MKFKNIKLFIVLFLIVFILSACSKPTNSSSSKSNIVPKNELLVHFINVGQGDSILLQSSTKNMLIDAGPKSNSDKLIKYLKEVGVKKLDVIVATHPHEDHIGGMVAVIKNFDIGVFYAPKKTANTNVFENMVKALQDKNLKINVAKAGIKIDFDKDIPCEMLAPNSDSYEDINNYSAVLKVNYKDTSFLFTGDAEKLSEREIIQKGSDLKADVLKLGHHGSSSSSSKEFLDKVSPKYAIISCAKNNDYGHPHKETITEMNKRNIKVFRTDMDGDIILKSDGKNIYKK